MSVIQSSNVQIVANQTIPGDTPKSLQLYLDFSAGSSFQLGLLLQQQMARIGAIQTIFVDNKDTDSAMILTFTGSGQNIKCKGRTQGYYNVLAVSPVDVNIASTSGILQLIHFLNIPVPGVVWATQ